MNTLTRWSAAVLLLVLLGWQFYAQAIQTVQITIEQWVTDTLHAQDFDIHFNLSKDGLSFVAHAKSITLPAPLEILDNVQINCQKTLWLSQQFACQRGSLSFTHTELGTQKLDFSLSAQPEQQHYQMNFSGLTLADGQITIDAELIQDSWQAEIKTSDLTIEKMAVWLPMVLEPDQLTQLSEWQFAGNLEFNAQLQGSQSQLRSIQTEWQLDSVNFTNELGTQVGETISAKGRIEIHAQPGRWQWKIKTELHAGQAYSDPVFLDLETAPISVSASGFWQRENRLVDVQQLAFLQRGVVDVAAQVRWEQNQLSQLTLTTKPFELASVYPIWIQPFSVGSAVASLILSGKMHADLQLAQQHYQLGVSMEALSIADNEQRFAINELNGHFGWSSSEQQMESELDWQQAQVYAVEIGAAKLKAISQNSGLSLLESVDVPVLDGHLLINAFSLDQTDTANIAWNFDGLLTPISMEALSQALDWPLLHGKLSGVIPKVSYQQQQLKIDGALQLKLFDGTTVIRDLEMVTPLGSLPQLYANIDIDNLDLELLTKTFDFGRITGRLDGYVHQLRLSNWQPVQFDGYLATPQDNPGKRRISQRAVDNLSQIGGGASGLLSRSFLRFFDDFSYQKLGLKCQLSNGVCEMSGIEEAEQGYYIVKGGGGLPPWINVVGYTRRVNWTDLIERLQAVSQSSGPVIQ